MESECEKMSGTIYLGTQSWSNRYWRGNFYPPKTASENYLVEYAKRLHAVEIDSTFYAIPRAEVLQHWYEMTPTDFRFTAKFPRVITHEKMLVDAAGETRQFLDAMALLGDKAGPLVLQFPYGFSPQHRARLAEFLGGLPREFRYAVEVRHPDWFAEPFYDLLRDLDVSLVIGDYGKPPTSIQVPTPWSYIRLVGSHHDFPNGPVDALLDRSAELDHWSRAIARLAANGVTVWAFASDVYQGHAPSTILALAERLNAI